MKTSALVLSLVLLVGCAGKAGKIRSPPKVPIAALPPCYHPIPLLSERASYLAPERQIEVWLDERAQALVTDPRAAISYTALTSSLRLALSVASDPLQAVKPEIASKLIDLADSVSRDMLRCGASYDEERLALRYLRLWLIQKQQGAPIIKQKKTGEQP